MKLIIDIPSEMLEDAKADMLLDIELPHITKAIANGIPLDDIKAEIQEEISLPNHTWFGGGMEYCLDIIDKHIGESEGC